MTTATSRGGGRCGGGGVTTAISSSVVTKVTTAATDGIRYYRVLLGVASTATVKKGVGTTSDNVRGGATAWGITAIRGLGDGGSPQS